MELGEEELLRVVLDHSPTLHAFWDRDLRCQFANLAYERAFGAARGGLVGTSMRDLKPMFGLNEREIMAALRGEHQVFERVLRWADGDERYGLVEYIPIHEEGEIAGFVAHITDVSALKRSEAALRAEIIAREHTHAQLRASEGALREAQRLGQVGSWEWDVAADVITWSEQLGALFGRSASTPPPSFADIPALYSPESWALLAPAMQRAATEGEPYILELEYVRTDGSRGWMEARGAAIRNDDGVVARLHGTGHDISTRRRAEQDRIQREVAESASENKTLLLSRVSHELRTPLNGILGFAQLLQLEPSLEKTQRQWADLVYQSGQHMLGLVDQVLELSAAESGQMSLVDEEVEVVGLLRERMLHASRAAKAAGAKLVGLAEELEPLVIHVDRTRLRQVIDDLFTHMLEHTTAGSEVKIAVAGHGAGGVELSFQDVARELSSEQVARAFMPFERAGTENSAFRKGLGLALTKNVLERLGGSLGLETDATAGTTYRARIPSRREI